MRKLVFSTALVLSLGLVGCSEKTTNEEVPIEELSNNETLSLGVTEGGKVTVEEYKQVKFGMTSIEVFNILGTKGTVVSKSGPDEESHTTVIYKFETVGDTSISEMTFEDDKLSYKAQIGLETTEMEVNLEQLNMLIKGMSNEKAFEILGGKGALVAESDVLEIYSYNSPTSDADITVLFIEDKFKSIGEVKRDM